MLARLSEEGKADFPLAIKGAPRLASSAVTHRASGCLLKGSEPEQSPHSLRGSAGFSSSRHCFSFILSQTLLANFIDKIHNLGLESSLLFSCERWGVQCFFSMLPILPHSLHPPKARFQPVLCRGMELRDTALHPAFKWSSAFRWGTKSTTTRSEPKAKRRWGGQPAQD